MGAKLKAFWAKLNSDLGSLWEQDKGFVILFGIIILIIKFRDIIIDLLVSSAKREFQTTETKSYALSAKESTENKQADALVAQAKADAAQQATNDQAVTEDWNKKK